MKWHNFRGGHAALDAAIEWKAEMDGSLQQSERGIFCYFSMRLRKSWQIWCNKYCWAKSD